MAVNCSQTYAWHTNFSNYDYYRNATFFNDLEAGDYAKIITYGILIVGGIFGNVSVLLTVTLNRSMRTTINYYVANLAVADLMICMCCMIAHSINVLTHPVYILGAFMCKFNNFIQMTSMTCSVLTMSAISCDRFTAVFFPLHVRVTKQRPVVILSLVWIVSLVVSIPFLIFKKHYVMEWRNFLEPKCSEEWPAHWAFEPSINRCVKQFPLKTIYYTFVTITLFFLPAAIMTTAYSLILCKLWVAQVPGEHSDMNLEIQRRSKKRVIKMVFVVLVAFIICWMPLQGLFLYSIYGHKSYLHGAVPLWFKDFQFFAYFIAHGNSFLNPIIYGGFNKTFRDGFCMTLKCGIHHQPEETPNPEKETCETQQSKVSSVWRRCSGSISSIWVRRKTSSQVDRGIIANKAAVKTTAV